MSVIVSVEFCGIVKRETEIESQLPIPTYEISRFVRLWKVRSRVRRWFTVAKAEEIPDGGNVVVEVNDKDVAVFRVGDAFHAIDDLCPHAGASLSGGSVENGVVTCPWHYWRFRLVDGAWADNPRIKTGCYPVRVEGGLVQIEVADKEETKK